MTKASLEAKMPGAAASHHFDVERIRRDFPILREKVHGKPLVYLDNAASAQKPRSVIEAVADFYRHDNANVHRGVHALSQRATEAYEGARQRVRTFLNAPAVEEIVFVRGATEGINLMAQTLGRSRLEPGDEVVVTALEHHSNIVPWQMICEERGALLRVVPMNLEGDLLLDDYAGLLTHRTRVVAAGHISNALGTVNPIREMAELAHGVGAVMVVDGAQGAPHVRIDVQDLGCDAYVISGHKMFGPTGIGALFGRAELLRSLPPFQGGGDMIHTVSFEGTEYADIPARFEAGTPNIAGTVGLAAAIDYLEDLPWDAVEAHEADLVSYAVEQIRGVPGVTLVGQPSRRVGVVSFLMDDVHAHDVGTIVDMEGVAIRTGHHCAQPVMDFYGVAATARASFAFYNTRDEVDRLVEALGRVREVFT